VVGHNEGYLAVRCTGLKFLVFDIWSNCVITVGNWLIQ